MQLNSNVTKIKESILQTLLDNQCISPFTDIQVVMEKIPKGKNTMVTANRVGNTPRGTNKWLFRSEFRNMKHIDNSDGKTHPAFDDLHKDMLIDAEIENGEKKHQITIGMLRTFQCIVRDER